MTSERKNIAKSTHKAMPPTTTEEQDTVTASQRVINKTWEFTQATIALCVTFALVFVSIQKIESEELKNAFFLIIGFYFGRTNHTNTGGIPKTRSLISGENFITWVCIYITYVVCEIVYKYLL